MSSDFSPRREAFKILLRYEASSRGQGEKSNRLIHEALSRAPKASTADRSLLTALVYGVLRHWFTLEASLQPLSKFSWKKLPSASRTLLKLGLFQLRYLDQVPDYAALNTTLELAKQQKLSAKSIAFLNAVLRAAQRQETYPSQSFPDWLSARLGKYYSPEQIEAMAAVLQAPAPLSLRINTLKTSVEDYQKRLEAAGIAFQVPEPESVPEGLVLEGFHGSPIHLPGYAEGDFTIQDLSSALVAHWLDPQPGEIIVDLCAAPGSKTTHLAALMQNQGDILAVDVSAKRLKSLEDNLQRLGVSNVTPVEADALIFSVPEGKLADRVLVDAPCSGLGTLRKHPEILIHQTEKHLAQYSGLQQALLAHGWHLLRPGGILVYSTCSILPAENTEVVQAFLKQHPEAVLKTDLQRLITATADGFYLAKLYKPL